MPCSPEFIVSSEVRDLGVRVLCATVENLNNHSPHRDLDELRNKYADSLKTSLTSDFVKIDSILTGFRTLHEKVGRSNRKFPASPESLVNLFLSRGVIPRINPVVDLYNLVSLDTRLALGAHDISGIAGNVTLRLTDGTERFVPLGAQEPELVSSGEYCYIDDSNEVLCRLEHKQVEKTKVTVDSRSCFFIVQGNEATPPELIEATFQRLAELLSEFCSGTVSKVWNEAR
jgi:DNA/RNA-binding domain of Phe-tRNA-synthetase-like protein